MRLHFGHNIVLSLLVFFSDRFNGTFESKVVFLRPVVLPSRWSGLGLAHGAHFAAGGTTAIESTGAIGLETGHADTGGHLEPFENFARLRIDAAELAPFGFQGAVPKLAVDPRNAR